MNCFEHTKGGHEVAAVGICPHCGAAICAEHAQECQVETVRSNGVGSPSVEQHRALCCTDCQRSGACATTMAAGPDALR